MMGDTIKRLREAKGLSQEQLAEQLHVVRQTVSKWEKDLSAPDAGLLLQLAQVLGVSVGELLGQNVPAQENIMPDAPEHIAGAKPRRGLRAACWVLAAVCTAVLLYWVVTAIILRHFMETLDHSVGVIGGADGPTAILVTSAPVPYGWVWPVLTVLGLAAAVYGLWRTRKK